MTDAGEVAADVGLEYVVHPLGHDLQAQRLQGVVRVLPPKSEQTCTERGEGANHKYCCTEETERVWRSGHRPASNGSEENFGATCTEIAARQTGERYQRVGSLIAAAMIAANDVAGHLIQRQLRHAKFDTTVRYIQAGELFKKNAGGLVGL